MDCKLVHCNNQQRPIIRGSLARSVYERMLREEQLRNFDTSKWYKIDNNQVNDSISSKFIELNYDSETDTFIKTCYQKSDWLFTHIFNALAQTVLGLFMTSTSINGLLKRGSMFVFSNSQFNLFYDEIGTIKSDSDSSLLDIGSGDGRVTSVMSKYFNKTYCTEVSPVMKRLLVKRDYEILDADKWYENDLSFNLISCLNVLDRCDRPLTMIKKMRQKIKPNGRILLALVLPLNQYVESSANGHKPSESITLTGNSLEQHAQSFIQDYIEPNDLELIAWTKVPYLCEGDLELSYYWLNDVLFLLKPKSS
ncbi:protein-L-histidine N-pros-methyltransferase-like [Panonychus citri]|uniref:protein-L-histidine N-pros-methyltransferase-like n=1 Tax=Panonychus citri TaxID=50023 RepID=UPI0023083458|nr:protein-L-histidine N-pros-methyltransferase-like [Panonychus citri]XP_053211801.1 protein-L-histidine N-pros-methyltransferase-like [Panonychus citri]XP_053211802.1 protein-L-histidine N-pros-methyltransferase-like [Panonychus citri]